MSLGKVVGRIDECKSEVTRMDAEELALRILPGQSWTRRVFI
jgi:hypothetical protein